MYFGCADVGHVEDANAAHRSALAHRVRDAPPAAVEAAARRFARHEEQVLIDGHVALRRRAVRMPSSASGCCAIRDVPHLVAVVVALNGVVPGEREIGVRDARECSDGGEFETSRMFHAASAARSTMTRLVVSLLQSVVDAGASPTRGSGLGGDVDMSIAGVARMVIDGDDDPSSTWHPRAGRSPTQPTRPIRLPDARQVERTNDSSFINVESSWSGRTREQRSGHGRHLVEDRHGPSEPRPPPGVAASIFCMRSISVV